MTATSLTPPLPTANESCDATTILQRTLQRPVSLAGIGLHSGKEVQIRFCPASPNTGLRFRRVDLPGQPEIPVLVDFVFSTARSTNIALGEAKIYTIEHLLAAVYALGIHNLIIEIDNVEPPILDGSALPFLQALQEGGLEQQEVKTPLYRVKEPLFVSHEGAHLIALPSDHFQVSFTLDYPQVPAIGCQYFSLIVGAQSFEKELASARTFCLYEELENLQKRGLIRGGSLDSGVVVQGDRVMNPEGTRYSNEMVRHKILDLVGDMTLVGFPFLAHIIAIRAGHTSNALLAQQLRNSFKKENVA